MLAEFENHLSQTEAKCSHGKTLFERTNKTMVALSAGIEALYEKLACIKPVVFIVSMMSHVHRKSFVLLVLFRIN